MNQQAVETLKFKIGISGTFWEKSPAFSIWVNDTMFVSGTLDSEEVQYFEFSADLVEDSEHSLKIRLENKTDADTIVQDDTIIKDMLLNIESIEIDEIELSSLKWSESKFLPDSDSRPIIDNCVNLGWNGAYTLTFRSPYYHWLLENF